MYPRFSSAYRLLGAAKAPVESIRMNRDLVRDHVFNIADLDAILKRTVRTTLLLLPSSSSLGLLTRP